MGGTGRSLGKTFLLHCQRRHPELLKVPTYLLQQLQRFQQFRISIQGNSEFILFINHRREDLTFLVPTRPAVCVCALLVFLVVCACSLFFTAGQSYENSSARVLIVLDFILLVNWMRIGSKGKSNG